MRDRRNALLRRTDRRRDCRRPQGTSQHGDARLEGGQSVALRRADHGGMLMEPELWQRVTDLFDEAMTREPKERIAFLEKACEGDRDLRKQDERLGRKAALKLFPHSLTTDETQLSRFKNEARSASALNHPNILTVYEIGAEGNRRFIATEFIEGITLRASLARGRIDPHAALEIVVQVASALGAAHEAGVVHRDIKPENIMLRPDGYVKVLDFGIA